jgi:citrate lyase beta subunit
MKHQQHKLDFAFIREPEEFTKYTERNLLQYCLGATMYMPGTKKDIQKIILSKKWPELTSIVMCFEDAIAEEDLPLAEENVIGVLNGLSQAIDNKKITLNDLPLLIIRVRNVEQFTNFTNKLSEKQIKLLTAFNFPKFNSINAQDYMLQLSKLNNVHNEIIYGMPILESVEIALKESRIQELLAIKNVLDKYKNLILNIRVGATDLSSCFGVRRGMDYTIYDIMVVRDCLSDILNIFSRANEYYTISAPVWEYFFVDKNKKFEGIKDIDIQTSLIKREPIVNDATDGLLREIILDKANGFIGKTIIHPSHIKYVNALQAVTREEYDDAMQIVGTPGGVIKSVKANKMNEINPHMSWAKKIIAKAKIYGVIENEDSYLELFSE